MPKHSIMIVEDEPISAKITEKIVRQLGYEVAGVFDTGEEAVENAAALAPDLALMDIVLAGEMDGVRAARLLSAELGIPVIFLTSTTDEVIGRVGDCGACGYIHKPVKLLDLKANLEMALARRGSVRALRFADERRAVLDALQLAVVLAGTDGAVRWANATAERLLGRELEEMEGLTAASALSGLFELPAEAMMAAARGEHCGLTLPGADGRQWRVSVSPALSQEGGLMGAVIGFQPRDKAV